MNPLLQQIQEEKESNYQQAKKDVLQAIHSFEKLDDAQKVKLTNEISGNKILYEFLKNISW